MDLTTYAAVLFSAKCSVAINAAGDLQLLLDEHASCASPLALDIPVLVANTWKTCKIAADFTGLDQVISVGLKLTANDPGACSLWVDQIMAAKAIAGIKSWTLDDTVDILDARGFDDAGLPHPVAGNYNWTGSFEGYKDGAPLTKGSEVYVELQESSTATQQWRGMALISGRHINVSSDGLVTYSYDFVGKGGLEEPTT
jgi:hypothetical protein